ncbi:MAG TPA: hypothetical protein VG246_08915 [Acidimicrobiales bacterium]|nr:hypothetical protein [Acidimicrobiales bacterium]
MSDSRGNASTHTRATRSELWTTVGIFVALCVVVLMRSPQLLEPDDYAYRASIVALSQGHLLLTNAQFLSLQAQLSRHGGGGILQWVHLRDGKWISQKNPGYPFLAVIFQWLHALRVAPLFYGACACAGLFYGARRWLGRWGGTIAVALYCSSGAALIFAWRATMPTFTDASLIAAGAGLLLGVLVSEDDDPRRRFLFGALAFLALDGAVFVRYTDVVELLVALVTVFLFARSSGLTKAMISGWIAIVAAFAVFDLWINHLLYGNYLKTGYASGLVTFATSAFAPNIERMPSRLIASMPMSILALAALLWIAVRTFTSRADGGGIARRDGAVASVLAVGWLAIWALYLTYTWTVDQTLGPGNPVHVIRFYLPTLGLIALLAAWFLVRLPRWIAPALLVMVFGLGLWYYVAPSNDTIVHRGPPPVERSVSST